MDSEPLWREEFGRFARDLLRRTGKLVADVRAEYRESREAEMSKILGVARSQLLTFTRSMAESLLKNDDSGHRRAGLMILEDYFGAECKGDSHLIATVSQMSANDCDSHVRKVAMWTLGRLLEATRDRTVGRHLAGIATDASKAIEERAAAYVALLDLDGRNRPVDRDAAHRIEQMDESLVRDYLLLDDPGGESLKSR